MATSKARRGGERVPAAIVATPTSAAPAPAPAATDAELALLALYAEDAFCQANGRRVRTDPRLAPWNVLGTLAAVDAPLRFGKHTVGAKECFYGWLLERGPERVLAIRGTEGCREWLIDAIIAPRTVHPVAGKVESGFWSVYQSMRIDGGPITSIEGPVTVVGHSLGAALATFASLELARAGQKVRGVFVASPHPGDRDFCKAFGAEVPDHVLYRNVDDIVPRLPFWFKYSSVPNVRMLSAKAAGTTIGGGMGGQHHVISYVALMDRKALKTFKPLPCDRKFLDCVKVPK